MKSGKQRKAEIKLARLQRKEKLLTGKYSYPVYVLPRGSIAVDAYALAPTNSYGRADFVYRGFYVDAPFRCRDCGAKRVWTAEAQKWWYEVAKGDMFTSAIRCTPCRAKERKRVAKAREVWAAGLAKKAIKAAQCASVN